MDAQPGAGRGPWERLALVTAVLLRGTDERKNNSRGFPSPPCPPTAAPPALSSPGPRLFHLRPRCDRAPPTPAARHRPAPLRPGPAKWPLARAGPGGGDAGLRPPLHSLPKCSAPPKFGCSQVPGEKREISASSPCKADDASCRLTLSSSS